MREHLRELLPLLLVGLVLLVFQLTRDGGYILSFLPFVEISATPTPSTVDRATATPKPRKVIAASTPVSAVCNASRPSFVDGIAALKSILGASMGDALECERSVDDQGDTQQSTTTGLAYYRRKLNVACFTTGWEHWALKASGLVYWTGDAVDPPGDASPTTH